MSLPSSLRILSIIWFKSSILTLDLGRVKPPRSATTSAWGSAGSDNCIPWGVNSIFFALSILVNVIKTDSLSLIA